MLVTIRRVRAGERTQLPVRHGWASMTVEESGYVISMIEGACFVTDRELLAACTAAAGRGEKDAGKAL